MARPTLLTPKVQRTICAALRDGHPFEVACEFAGIAPSTGYEWFARGEGHDRRRPATSPYREFAEAVARVEGAVWRERGFALAQSNEETASREGFAETEHEGARRSTFGDVDELARPTNPTTSHQDARFAESPGISRHVQAHDELAEPQNWSETGDAPANPSESQRNAEFAEVTEPTKSDTQRDRARAREENGDKEPRRAPMPWLSQRSRERSILDMDF
jgi:hypothetical protein